MEIIFLSFSLFFVSIIFLRSTKNFFSKKIFIDKPSDRSNHAIPTPKGAGLILMPILIFSTLLVFFLDGTLNQQWLVFTLLILILTVVSFLDDINNLPSSVRLFFHFLCVITSIYFLKNEFIVFFSNVSFFDNFNIDRRLIIFLFFFFIFLFWMWLINLFNFMDGMDGITPVQICSFTLGINFLSILGLVNGNLQILSLIIFTIFLAFYNFNKPPAKIFLGDVGSIPLGFIVGLVTLKCVLSYNIFIPLIILIMYHILDSSVTLIIRAWKRKNIFRAHSDHFYQRVLRSGKSHNYVLNKIKILNIFLLVLSISSTRFPAECLCIAVLTTSLLLYYFYRQGIKNG